MKNIHTQMRRFLSLMLALVMVTACMSPFTMETYAEASDALSLTLSDPSKTTYMQKEPIHIKATGTASGAWVGLYEKDDLDKLGTVPVYRWYYIADYNGKEVDITAQEFLDGPNRGNIDVGEYVIVLFGDGGYEKIVKKIEISVVKNPNYVPGQDMSMKLVNETKTTYKLGEPILVKASGTDAGAWVGLYGKDEIEDVGAVSSYRWYYVWEYNDKEVDLTRVNLDQSLRQRLEEGEYAIMLFADEGYGQVVKTIPITISGTIDISPSQFELEVEKTEYKYGENVMVRATGTGIFDGAWVGLYPANTENYEGTYLRYYYVKNKENQFVAIQGQAAGKIETTKLDEGKYKLVLFADDSYKYPVKSVEFTVTRDRASTKVLREPGCVTFGKESVVYQDGYTEIREIQPLGGHIWGENIHVEGTTKHQQACQRPGCERTKTTACVMDAGVVTKAAKVSKTGERTFTCESCGHVVTASIAAIEKAPKLSATSLTYNGKDRKPAVKALYDTNGELIAKKFYTVQYESSCKKVGAYKATVTFKGDYAGTYTLSYKINPKAVTLKSLTAGKKSIKVKWNKATAETSGYRIAYSTNKNFKNVKYVKVTKKSQAVKTIKNLKAGKKYYVKIRAYKTSGGKTYYSAWSKVKSVTTKKKG
ncbi:MAG: fibronectin type III domain-containing protein [Firmicutes bacterium]|nr:fibronectin type III domain-containing protein [Bacillota bacterium]